MFRFERRRRRRNSQIARLGRRGPSPATSSGSHCAGGGEVSEGGRSPPPSSLAVDVFAGGGFGGAGGVPLLPQEHLPQPDRPTVEGNGGAGQVQAPRAVDLL